METRKRTNARAERDAQQRQDADRIATANAERAQGRAEIENAAERARVATLQHKQGGYQPS